MSLIDGLIDELNKSADEWNESNMFELARMCREAADTIWQLRDDLQRANAENAKLREQIHWLKQGDILHVLTDQEYIDQCEREHLMQVSIDALDKENAKLRELVRDYDHCSMHADCDRCEYDGTTSTHCPLSPCFPDIDELREREMEVDA